MSDLYKPRLPGCFSGLFPSFQRVTKPTASFLPTSPSLITHPSPNSSKKVSRDPYFDACCGHISSGPQTRSDELFFLPPYSTENEKKDGFDKEVFDTIEKNIQECSGELRKISLALQENPELAEHEVFAHKMLTEYLGKLEGVEVTPHYLLPTAFKATFTNSLEGLKTEKGRTVSFNSELDALPGIGHACGHNLICIGGLAAFLSTKAALIKHHIPGTVVLFGTPAEEGAGGKGAMAKLGAWKNVDACLMLHPTSGPERRQQIASCLAIQILRVEFRGKTTHAAASPWEGINALDACTIAYTSISALRQQLKPDVRVHGVIEPNEMTPNVIPDYASMRYYCRAPTAKLVLELKKKVINCFKAAALATACTLSITEGQMFTEVRNNPSLASEFSRVMRVKYGAQTDIDLEGSFGGSTDMGVVSYEVPGLHPTFAITDGSKGRNHTIGFAKAAATEYAHAETLKTAAGIAAAGCRILWDTDWAEKVKESWKDDIAKHS